MNKKRLYKRNVEQLKSTFLCQSKHYGFFWFNIYISLNKAIWEDEVDYGPIPSKMVLVQSR